MKDCWLKGSESAHKAPEWWKALQAKRRPRSEESVKMNAAKKFRMLQRLSILPSILRTLCVAKDTHRQSFRYM